jgi:type IV pilus assembly protein PilE
MKRNKGFTLIELMIVVVVIAILAAIAMPLYSDYVRRGRIADATANLSGLRVRMEQYFQDNRTYVNAAGDCGVDVTTTPGPNFTYTCAAEELPVQLFTITATGAGSMNGFIYTINQMNTRTSVIDSDKVPGWSTPTVDCWTTKPGGAC